MDAPIDNAPPAAVATSAPRPSTSLVPLPIDLELNVYEMQYTQCCHTATLNWLCFELQALCQA